MQTTSERLTLAQLSLEGLSIGDAFGDCFFSYDDAPTPIQSRLLPNEPWYFTDDTNMALSVYEVLHHHAEISQDELAKSFALHYDASRGYGPAMHRLLDKITSGESWQAVSKGLFDGQGSYGNGAAMRVAPIGAYFADDLNKAVDQSRKSAEITHAHAEGIVGAIAVAVAAAIAVKLQNEPLPSRYEFLDMMLPFIPDSEVKSGIRRARDIQTNVVDHVVRMIGNGLQMSAQDTIPFALWCVGESLASFEDAMWLTVSGRGDMDTNCAIVGGIVSLYVGNAGIPQEWINKREPLPEWAFQ